MSVPATLRLFTCAVLLMLLPVYDAQIDNAACGQSTYSDLAGSITSLNYPSNYQNYQACIYYIETPSLSTINFTFNGLGLEQTSTCYYDWIEFTCESNAISQPIRYCGFGYRPVLSFKPCSRVRLSFVSDGSVTNIGFFVSYEIEPIRCRGNCAPVSNGASYYCPCDANQTPFIPPPYDQCPNGCYSNSPYCACSFPPSNTYSNNSTPPYTNISQPTSPHTNISQSTSPHINISQPTTRTPFPQSNSTGSPVFPLSTGYPVLPAACGQSTYNDPTGTITSQNYPNYYQNYQTCNYYINAPSLSTINFTFNGLGLEQTSTCYYDWIEFTCESNSISQTIKYCGFGYRPVLSFKPCSRVLLRFLTDGSVTNIGFSVSYQIEPIRCQGSCAPVSNGASYYCPCDANQTPFIPPPYDQCPNGCYSNSPYCACSFPPTNTDSNNSTPSYTNISQPTSPHTNFSQPTTRTSFPQHNSTGFPVFPLSTEYPVVPADCGQSTYSDLTGIITSQNYPNYYPNYQTCNYYINAPSLSTINFTFNGLGLEQTSNCYFDWIEFTCESNAISQPVRYCGFGYRPELSFKPCSRVLLRFISDGSVTNIGFSVSYEIEPIRCQGNCAPVSNGPSYYCPCDANQTPYIAPPYDECPYGCFSSSPYCACSYPPNNADSNSSSSPIFSTESPLGQSYCSSNPCLFGGTCINSANGGFCFCAPGYVGVTCAVAIGGNSSGNVSQWATTRPSLVTGGSVRPSTVNAGNRTGNVSLSATTRLLLVTPSSPPATVNAGNRTGNVFQSAPTRPPLVASTRRP